MKTEVCKSGILSENREVHGDENGKKLFSESG